MGCKKEKMKTIAFLQNSVYSVKKMQSMNDTTKFFMGEVVEPKEIDVAFWFWAIDL